MTPSDPDQEFIAVDELVVRALFENPADLDESSQWQFRHDKDRDECAESVFWRKYAASNAILHEYGYKLESIKNARLTANQKPPVKYDGYREVRVGAVRKIVSGRGHSMDVLHVPEPDNPSHSHIFIRAATGTSPKKLKAPDILELVHLLLKELTPLVRP